jgi:hypothetical protein
MKVKNFELKNGNQGESYHPEDGDSFVVRFPKVGVSEPSLILKECLIGSELTHLGIKPYWTKPKKEKTIKIKFLSWIPINDKNSHWEKIRGRW